MDGSKDKSYTGMATPPADKAETTGIFKLLKVVSGPMPETMSS